jgi:hypothetical protein
MNIRGCADAKRFTVLAEDPDVVTLRTSATNGSMSFWGRGEELWLDVWGLNPGWLGLVG